MHRLSKICHCLHLLRCRTHFNNNDDYEEDNDDDDEDYDCGAEHDRRPLDAEDISSCSSALCIAVITMMIVKNFKSPI